MSQLARTNPTPRHNLVGPLLLIVLGMLFLLVNLGAVPGLTWRSVCSSGRSFWSCWALRSSWPVICHGEVSLSGC